MEKIVRDWNVPGIGVAIVVGDRVVLARGWGYRDYGEKLPFTTRTTVPIASNTKLFTAVVLSGRTWEELVQERILDPLGMTSTVFS